jgi:hypothetical protein
MGSLALVLCREGAVEASSYHLVRKLSNRPLRGENLCHTRRLKPPEVKADQGVLGAALCYGQSAGK